MYKIRTKPRKQLHLVLGLLLATALLGIVILLPPEGILVKGLFFLIFFAAVFYLMRFALNHSRRALLLSAGITLLFLLRAFGLSHWLYPLLISALIISLEVYASKK